MGMFGHVSSGTVSIKSNNFFLSAESRLWVCQNGEMLSTYIYRDKGSRKSSYSNRLDLARYFIQLTTRITMNRSIMSSTLHLCMATGILQPHHHHWKVASAITACHAK